MSKKINYELIKREQAFQLYKKLKNLKAVSEIPGMPSYATLLKWKEEDNWDERIEKTKEKLEKWEMILSKLESDSLLKDDVAHLLLLNNLLERTVKAIIDKDLEPTSWKEAIDTLKMIFEQKRLLLGRATSKSEIDFDFTGLDEYEIRETLRKINELLQGIPLPKSPEEKIKALIKQKVDLENVLEDKTRESIDINKEEEKDDETEEEKIFAEKLERSKEEREKFLAKLLEEEENEDES